MVEGRLTVAVINLSRARAAIMEEGLRASGGGPRRGGPEDGRPLALFGAALAGIAECAPTPAVEPALRRVA